MAAQKLLGSSKRRLVYLPGRRDQLEVWPKLCMQRIRAIPNHLQPTTTFRSFWSKRTDNDMATALYGMNHLTNICFPVGSRGQKMKDRAIMPHVVGRNNQFSLRNVGDQPLNAIREFAQPLPCGRDSGLRNIQNGQVGVAPSEQIIHQSGLTSADIDDGGRWSSACLLDECERRFKVRPVPAHPIGCRLKVNPVPVRLSVHTPQYLTLDQMPVNL